MLQDQDLPSLPLIFLKHQPVPQPIPSQTPPPQPQTPPTQPQTPQPQVYDAPMLYHTQ